MFNQNDDILDQLGVRPEGDPRGGCLIIIATTILFFIIAYFISKI